MRRKLFTLLLLACLTAAAQTFTPKHIRVEAPEGMDQADILHTAGLEEGKPITKQEIEAALGKLADTGSFTDLSYSTSADTLVLKLTGSPVAQTVPVRFSNFIWWTPAELTALVQARVPLYQGKLPLRGNLTDQVVAALVAILKEKGIADPEVTVVEGMKATSITLDITRPSILLGTIDVQGSLPVVASTLAQMKAGYKDQEFDQQVLTKGIPLNVSDLYHNAGYIDATTSPTTFAAPRKDKDRYLIDATVTVQPGELYRIGKMDFDAPPPLSRADDEKAVGLKPGDPAGTFPLEHATDALAFAYTRHGFLDARAQHTTANNTSTHTVDCTFTVQPGELYHLASVNTAALSPELQAAFQRSFKGKPGDVSGDDLNREILNALTDIHAEKQTRIKSLHDNATHTETIVLSSAAAHQ